MRKRTDRLARLSHLTDQIWRLHRRKCAESEAELERRSAAERAAFEALGTGLVDPRLLLDQMGLLSARRREAERLHEERLALNREAGRRAKLMENLSDEASAQQRREFSTEELRRLIGRPDVSAR
jgi:hypothetical protein